MAEHTPLQVDHILLLITHLLLQMKMLCPFSIAGIPRHCTSVGTNIFNSSTPLIISLVLLARDHKPRLKVGCV